MSTARHSLLGILLVFALPLMANAAPLPVEVSSIAAERDGNDIVVTWDSAGSGISYYRVYWSSMSILENAGDYDDLQETAGPETTLTLKNAPKSDVYVAVIAVDADGQESPTFAEEALAAATVPAASNRPTGKAPELKVVKTRADGTDAFRITFDHPVALSIDALLEAVTVEDEKGRPLAVTGMELSNETELLVMTEPQVAGKYRVTLAKNAFYGLPETLGQGAQLAMLSKPASAAFVSEAEPASSSAQASSSSLAASSSSASSVATPVTSSRSVPSVSSASSVSSENSSTPVVSPPTRTSSSSLSSMAAGPIRSLSLRPYTRPDGYVDIEANWVVDADADVVGLAIAQSIDGGKTFSDWQPIDSTLRTVRIARIPAGNFGISLIAADSTGQISEPAVQTLLIAAQTTTPSAGRPVTGSVTGSGSPLTSSGPASILFTIVAAGALAGSRLGRKVLPRQ